MTGNITGKMCTKCGKLKKLSDFHKDKSMKNGVRSHCKKCIKKFYIKYNQTEVVKKRIEEDKKIKVSKKRCCGCKQIKFLSEFNKDKSKSSGLTSRCKKCGRKDNKKYRLNNKEKEATRKRKYNQTKSGKRSMRKKARNAKAKRRGWKTPTPINNWFKGSNLHHLHIDDDHKECIFIPISLHKSIPHAFNNKKLMKKINKAAFEWLCNQEKL